MKKYKKNRYICPTTASISVAQIHCFSSPLRRLLLANNLKEYLFLWLASLRIPLYLSCISVLQTHNIEPSSMSVQADNTKHPTLEREAQFTGKTHRHTSLSAVHTGALLRASMNHYYGHMSLSSQLCRFSHLRTEGLQTSIILVLIFQ